MRGSEKDSSILSNIIITNCGGGLGKEVGHRYEAYRKRDSRKAPRVILRAE